MLRMQIGIEVEIFPVIVHANEQTQRCIAWMRVLFDVIRSWRYVLSTAPIERKVSVERNRQSQLNQE